jgi:hypothetical protein
MEKGGKKIMTYQKPELRKVESAIEVIQSMTKIAPPTPDSAHKLTVAAYQSDE